MKKTLLSLVLAFSVATVLMSFDLNRTFKNNSKELSIGDNEWGPSKTTSCFKYLKYQIKKAEYNGKWYIRFENNYNKSISMSIEVNGNTGTKKDSGRFTVKSGGTSSQYYFVDENATRIDFSIDKVKFGDTSWGGPYAGCDH